MSDDRVRNRSGFEDRGDYGERGRRYDDRESRSNDREREFDQGDRSPYGSFRGQGYEGGRGFEGRGSEGGRGEGREDDRGRSGESRGGYGRQWGSGRFEGGREESRGGYGESRGGYGPGRGEWGRGFRGGYSEDEPSSRYSRQGGGYGGYGGDYGQYGGFGGEDRTSGFAGRRYGSPIGGGYSPRGYGFETSESGSAGESSWGSRFGGSSSREAGGIFERERGRFTGKGPKGYQRSDDRIREDVSDALERDGELDASDVEVIVAGGEVTLEGTVPDRRSKRRAEDLIEDLPGVKEVHNRLRVKKADESKGGLFGLGKDKDEKTAAEKSSDRGSIRGTPTV